jgi:hypothetical protein
MNQVTQLRNALRPHLSWHGARLSFLAAFLIALLRVKTINLAELATAFSGKAQTIRRQLRCPVATITLSGFKIAQNFMIAD